MLSPTDLTHPRDALMRAMERVYRYRMTTTSGGNISLRDDNGDIWIDRGGRLSRVGRMRATTLIATIEHLLAPTGRRVDRAQPMVEARLADGSRVCAVIAPVAVDGPCLSIRRFAPRSLPLERFAPAPVGTLLRTLVDSRANVVVSGAPRFRLSYRLGGDGILAGRFEIAPPAFTSST